MTDLLPENPDERRMFDVGAELHGGPLVAIAAAIYVQRSIISVPGASFYEQSTIHYNELLKAATRPTPSERPVARVREALEHLECETLSEALRGNLCHDNCRCSDQPWCIQMLAADALVATESD